MPDQTHPSLDDGAREADPSDALSLGILAERIDGVRDVVRLHDAHHTERHAQVLDELRGLKTAGDARGAALLSALVDAHQAHATASTRIMLMLILGLLGVVGVKAVDMMSAAKELGVAGVPGVSAAAAAPPEPAERAEPGSHVSIMTDPTVDPQD